MNSNKVITEALKTGAIYNVCGADDQMRVISFYVEWDHKATTGQLKTIPTVKKLQPPLRSLRHLFCISMTILIKPKMNRVVILNLSQMLNVLCGAS